MSPGKRTLTVGLDDNTYKVVDVGELVIINKALGEKKNQTSISFCYLLLSSICQISL